MDDLSNDFLAETNESLAKLDVELVKLEQTPDDKALLGSIFRIMHTIKGTCGFLGLAKLGSVAHASENILDMVRDDKIAINPERISIILESIDVIKTLVKSLEETGSESDMDVSNLINRLNAATVDSAVSSVPSEPAEAPKAEAEHSEQVVPEIKNEEKSLDSGGFTDVIKDIEALITKKDETEAKIEKFKTETEAMKKPAADPKKAAPAAHKDHKSTAQQTIRVSLDSLEGLMQMVSELVLTRNQLLQISRRNRDSEFTMPLQRLNHITSELQERVMKTRMQPIGNAWAQFKNYKRFSS